MFDIFKQTSRLDFKFPNLCQKKNVKLIFVKKTILPLEQMSTDNTVVVVAAAVVLTFVTFFVVVVVVAIQHPTHVTYFHLNNVTCYSNI